MAPAQTIISSVTVVNNAFHGTSVSKADVIRRDGFKAGASVGFLGSGVYFFHGGTALIRAKQWADGCAKKGRYGFPLAVIAASVELGRCLDYENEHHVELIEEIARVLRDRKRGDFSDGDVINLLALRVEIDTVKAPYHRPPFHGSKFQVYETHYLCVRNSPKILSLQLHHTWS